jgi:hypothetical protein
MRHKWNAPDSSDFYYVEHPIVAFPNIATHRGPKTEGQTLDPVVRIGLRRYKNDCQSSGETYRDLVEVPGRPRVFVRKGSYHDPDAPIRLCEEEDDWHRFNDIVWFGGTINCIVNKTGRRKGWSSELWPEIVVRLARKHVRLNYL